MTVDQVRALVEADAATLADAHDQEAAGIGTFQIIAM
jgi:hypothetical protein